MRRGAPPPSGPPAKRYKKSLDARVTQLKRQVAMFKPEEKHCPISFAATNVTDTAGSITILSGVPQGSDYDDRLGAKVRPTNIDLNIHLTSPIADITVESGVLYGCYLVKDSQGNGGAPVISGSSTSIFQAFSPVGAHVVGNNRSRFKVLRQWDISASEIYHGTMSPMVKWRVPLSGVTEYIGTGATDTSAGKNAYYLVILSNHTTDLVDFTVNGFYSFTDA